MMVTEITDLFGIKAKTAQGAEAFNRIIQHPTYNGHEVAPITLSYTNNHTLKKAVEIAKNIDAAAGTTWPGMEEILEQQLAHYNGQLDKLFNKEDLDLDCRVSTREFNMA